MLIILGIIQLTAGFSLFSGNAYGRCSGSSAGASGDRALFVGGAYPWWSLAMFALCINVVHGIVVYGEMSKPRR